MAITIKKVSTKKGIEAVIRFNYKLYKKQSVFGARSLR